MSTIDVCLILEGTYPYAVGGVSEWVHNLITGLPETRFAIVHLAANRDPKKRMYRTPSNLVKFIEWPLEIRSDGTANLSVPVPDAKIYHALSTGFAGMLGAQLKDTYRRPLIITEHGIYWREVADTPDARTCGFKLVPDGQSAINLNAIRETWQIRLTDMAHHAYRKADAITTVCESNVRLQATLGAPLSRCHVIPNSVDWRKFQPTTTRLLPSHQGTYRIGFVGRVVPIKDIETFLSAAQHVAYEMPSVEFYIIGPMNQDPEYAAKCQRLAEEMGIEDRVRFVGQDDPALWYPKLDIVVLTSISEGQPLVLLEAMAAGVPVVATDVGGCRELVEGGTLQDRALGQAGIITPPQNPTATAHAITTLCYNISRWREASKVGQGRVRCFYGTERLLESYQTLYDRWLEPEQILAAA